MRRPDRIRGIAAVLAAAALCVIPACAEDTILPVAAVCGDLQVGRGEECDVASVGCVECRVAKGFTCTDADCAPTCGDGTVVTGEECDPPNGVTCDSACRAGQKEEACNMSGYWLVRQTDFSVDSVLSQVQTSTNWYVFELLQDGEVFHVERGLNCGIKATGSANADLTEAGIRGLLRLNPQDKDTPAPRKPRQGLFSPLGNACTFSMDRNYMVRGGAPSLLPADFLSKPELSTLTPLPYEETPDKPSRTHLTGAADEDDDKYPGIMFRVSGNASGNRSVVQRDWNEYSTDADTHIPANAIEFTARVKFGNQENILFVNECPLVGCGILLAGSTPAQNLKDRVVFRYLGKSLGEPRVSRVIAGPLRQDVELDLKTCANARTTLPHDASKQ